MRSSRRSRRSSRASRRSSGFIATRHRCRTAPAEPGFVGRDLVTRWAAGGHVGRACGRDFDARRDLAYPPYIGLRFEVPVFTAGDVDARVRVRIARGPRQHRDGESLARRPAGRTGARPACLTCAGSAGGRCGRPNRFAATSWCGCAWRQTAASSGAMSAIRHGSSGRCSKRRSRTTSLPTSRCATNRSTAPIRGTICSAPNRASGRPMSPVIAGSSQ